MKQILYFIVIVQLYNYAITAPSNPETMTETPYVGEPELEDSFLNITSSLKRIKDKIGTIKKYIPKAFPTNATEMQTSQELEVNSSQFNGSYDNIMESINQIKTKVKLLKQTLRNINVVLDKEFGVNKKPEVLS